MFKKLFVMMLVATMLTGCGSGLVFAQEAVLDSEIVTGDTSIGVVAVPVETNEINLSELIGNIPNLIKMLPDLKQGVGYSFQNHDVVALTTIEIVNYAGLSLEAGYATGDSLVAVISGSVLELKDYITVPVLDKIELNVGLFAGMEQIGDANSFDWGVSATLIKFKF